MSGLFKTPKMPSIPEAPKPPVVDEARIRADQESQMRGRRGRAASLLTGASGDTGGATTAAKRLLGQ